MLIGDNVDYHLWREHYVSTNTHILLLRFDSDFILNFSLVSLTVTCLLDAVLPDLTVIWSTFAFAFNRSYIYPSNWPIVTPQSQLSFVHRKLSIITRYMTFDVRGILYIFTSTLLSDNIIFSNKYSKLKLYIQRKQRSYNTKLISFNLLNCANKQFIIKTKIFK